MTEPSDLARDAMDLAREADNKINAHEDLCAERYKNINDSLSRITKLMGWGGALLAGMILGLLGWSLNSQVEANKDAISALRSVEKRAPIQVVPMPMPNQPTHPYRYPDQ